MEDKQNMWEPWYLITLDNMVKMNVGFGTMSFHTARIKCLSIWAIDMMVVEKLVMQWVQKHGHKSKHHLPCGGIVLQPLNDMFELTHDGTIDNVTIEMPNPTKEGESTLTFKWKGLKSTPHLQIT
jgi:hypothetical protein